MLTTFQDQYEKLQKKTGDETVTQLATFKDDLNEGASLFLSALGRKFNKEYKKTSLVADQQYYQTSADTLRISEIRVLNGTTYFTPKLVVSESDWNDLNSITFTGNIPTHYYIRGFNEVGLFPIPSASLANGLIISLEPRHVELTAADVKTGTVTVTNGDQTVTHSGTSFTPQMVGRYLQVTDGTDGKWYRIGSYTSSSSIELENYYEGISGSGRAFRIGEVMKIPFEFLVGPVYYALQQYYLDQSDQNTADRYEARFERKLKEAKKLYGRSTSQMGVTRGLKTRRASWIDLTPPVTYP